MPANVIDHEKWKKAKKLAAEQGHAEDYAYIAGVYQRMGGGYTGGKDVEKSLALALPAFVIPGQVPRQTQPPALEALTGMPKPVDMARERLAFTEPVLRPEGLTKGLPMEATRAAAFQKFVADQLLKSSNEAEFRTKLFQHLHYDMKEGDPTLRRALVQRSLSFYKSRGRSAQTPIVERRAQGFRMEKSAGEGSKGGHVIGHTSSGKPIYAASASQSDKHRALRDHHKEEAERLRGEAAKMPMPEKRAKNLEANEHNTIAQQHHAVAARVGMNPYNPTNPKHEAQSALQASERKGVKLDGMEKADPRGGKYHRRVTDAETGKHRYYYSEEDYQKRPDAHVSGADAKKANAKRVIMDHIGDGEQTVDSLRALINHADPAMIADIVKQCVERGELEHDNGKLRKKQMQKGALPVMQSPEMLKQKAQAKAAQLEAAGIKTPVKAEHDRQKAEEKKEAEQSGAPLEKAEGARGGKVIGHTSSGKPIYASRHGYENAGHVLHDYSGGDEPEFAHAGTMHDKTGWTKKDHEEAAHAHREAQSGTSGAASGGTMGSAQSEEHRKLANAHAGAAKLTKSLEEAEGLHLWLLEKSAPGATGAGHKYVRRIPKPGGGFTYVYAGQKVGEGAGGGPKGTHEWAEGQTPKPAPKPQSTMEVGGVQIHKFAPGEEPRLPPGKLDKQGRPQARQWVDHHPNHPTYEQGGTAVKYGVDPKTGIPSDPERAKLHDDIIAKHFDHVPSVGPDKKPVAIVTMGGPASGKTTALKHLGFAARNDFVHVDSDAIKTGDAHLGTKGLPEFHEAASMGHLADGTPVSAKSGAAVVHEESSAIADRLRDKAISARKNVIIDGTGKNANKHIQLVKHLKEQGYHVHLVMPHQTAEKAKALNKERATATGRHVPEATVDEAYSKIPHNFDAVAEHAHEATLFNAKDGFPPKLVYSKNADGSETHHDPAFMKDFREQHGPDKMKKSLEAFTMKKIQKPELKPAVDAKKLIIDAFTKATPHDEGSPLEGMDNPAALEDTHLDIGIKNGSIKGK